MQTATSRRPRMPSDEPLGTLQPLSRLRAVRRMLLPTGVRKALSTLDDRDKHLPHWNRRLESLGRLQEWASTSSSVLELQQRVLGSDQLGNMMELERAFRVMMERIEFDGLDASDLHEEPLLIAAQVIDWWSRQMRTPPTAILERQY